MIENEILKKRALYEINEEYKHKDKNNFNNIFIDNECEYSVYYFSQNNLFRSYLMKLISDNNFDKFFKLIIIVSTIRLIIGTYASDST